MVSSALYCAVLEEELKSSICSKQRGMLKKGVVLSHDKNAVHTCLCTQLKTFFTFGIRKLVDHSNRCLEKLEDYVKNDSAFILVYCSEQLGCHGFPGT
jgi:hypothetical protein